MKYKSILTISNHKGSRVIHLGLIGKLTILILLSCLFTAICFGTLDWYALKQRTNMLQQSYNLGQEEYIHFSTFINTLTEQINERNAAFSELEKIEILMDPENAMPDQHISIEAKVNATKHSFLQRSFMLQTIPSGYPLAKAINISSPYGERIHPLKKIKHMHKGIDFATGYNKEVLATAAGVVETLAYDRGGYGRMIRIRHDFGFTTLYAHLQSAKVKRGDYVNKGDLIGLTGNSGLSTSAHLHYEIHYLNRKLNPIHFVQWDLTNYASIFAKIQSVKWSKLIQNVKQKIALQEQLSSPTDLKLAAN